MRLSSRLARLLPCAALLAGLTLSCAKVPDAIRPQAPKVSTKSGAQPWADTCSRCHGLRSPAAYSDARWNLVSHHMRLQAHLTGAEQRAIAEFLESAN